ncbi:MAG: selenide, water dikinase SelD [Acidobacteriota bacterium]|nr:selenide, water dikinase SelD [Acidobacteriota bacterium]
MRRLPRPDDPNLLVGYDTSDDAGVYQLTGEMALVETVDFFTPIVDDPREFGQIAAANSLSDVYAMGGRPLVALTIIGFPAAGAPELMEEILRGGIEKMSEARCAIAGGHSIRDEELKFGYAVTGLVDPQRIWRNVGARAGDALLLTKPIGTGVIATALKSGQASAESVEAAVRSMTRLNRDGAEALREIEPATRPSPIHAVTDVTGFGVLGHAREIAIGSDVSIELESARIEYLPGAVEAARAGHLAGGLKSNCEFLEGCVEFDESVSEDHHRLLFDPQTSGGLLVAIDEAAAQQAVEALERRAVPVRRIGRAVSRRSPLLRVI